MHLLLFVAPDPMVFGDFLKHIMELEGETCANGFGTKKCFFQVKSFFFPKERYVGDIPLQPILDINCSCRGAYGTASLEPKPFFRMGRYFDTLVTEAPTQIARESP